MKQDNAWDKKTRELRYHAVLEDLADYRQLDFYYTVFIPLYNRITALLRAVTKPEQRDKHFKWVDDLWEAGIGGWMLEQCSEECPIDDLAEDIGNIADYRCQRIWEQDDKWIYDVPSKEEILALNIQPNVVPEKAFKDGSVQKSMF